MNDKIEIQLDMSIYGKAKIKIFDNGALVRILPVKWEKRYEAFKKIYQSYVDNLKDK